MKTRRFFKGILYTSISLLMFSACSDDEDENAKWQMPESESGAFVLNSGVRGKNNAVLSFYNLENQSLTENVFAKTNGRLLGDLAQDVVMYGSKVYVSMTGSNLVYVLDKNAKILAEIKPTNDAGQPFEPRSLIAHDGNVYVSMQGGGYVGRIDTTQMKITAKVKVGPYPEQMTIVENKLYVALTSFATTGHESEVISIIDLDNFEAPAVEKKVGLNPSNIVSDNNGNIYVICLGNFADVKSVLKKIDNNGDVTTITEAYRMALSGSKLYIVYTSYTPDWLGRNDVVLSWYDTASGELHEKDFVTLDESNKAALSNTEGIEVDPVSESIYFLTSDYESNGDVYVFSSTGTFLKKFDTGGLNPIRVSFVTK